MSPDVQRILIRLPNWIGDVVMATPALRAIRKQFARAHITVMVKPYAREVIEPGPWYDEIVEAPLTRASCRRLRRPPIDLHLSLPNSFRSAWEAWRMGAKRRVGYHRNRRGWLLTDRIDPPRRDGRIYPENMVDYYLRLCAHLGCPPEDKRVELHPSPDAERLAEARLRALGIEDGCLVAINPGAKFGSSKCWLPERFAEVADALIEGAGAQIVILSAPGETEIVQAIKSRMRHSPIPLYPTGSRLNYLKSVIRRCRLLITNDTGTRHFAVAFGLPVVVIMGSTQSSYTDVNLEKTTIVRVDVDCGPCQEKVCPTDHRCMTRITSEMVLEAAEGALQTAE